VSRDARLRYAAQMIQHDNTTRLLTLDETAECLRARFPALRWSRRTLYREMAAGRLASVLVLNRRLVPESDLEAYMRLVVQAS